MSIFLYPMLIYCHYEFKDTGISVKSWSQMTTDMAQQLSVLVTLVEGLKVSSQHPHDGSKSNSRDPRAFFYAEGTRHA